MSKQTIFCWGMFAGCFLSVATIECVDMIFSSPSGPGQSQTIYPNDSDGPAITSFSSPSSEVGAGISSAPAFTFDDLLDALEMEESGGDADAVGDGGNAVGAYQIWKIYVDDVNRILGQKKYTYADRLDKFKSRKMTEIYIAHYYSHIKLYEALPEMISFEATPFQFAARIHNGGPNGWKKESTKAYWLRVKARMEKVRIVE